MSAEAFTHPDARAAAVETVGAFFAPSLGLHVELAWRADRLARLRLTDAPAASGLPQDPALRETAERVRRHLETGREDLSDVPVDLDAMSPFHRAVLEALREVGPGRTLTYGALARRVGNPDASRAVGAAMARNPIPVVVPCHRVVPSNGKMGNYSATGGVATKRALLALEGARF